MLFLLFQVKSMLILFSERELKKQKGKKNDRQHTLSKHKKRKVRPRYENEINSM